VVGHGSVESTAVSSAKVYKEVCGLVGISEVYTLKRSGARILPWGTPERDGNI